MTELTAGKTVREGPARPGRPSLRESATSPASGGAHGAPRQHLWQIDLLRVAPMLGVVAVHVLMYSAPASSRAAGAALMVLHVNREVFFFVSAFILSYVTRGGDRHVAPGRLWRRRYPLIAAPYVAWTLIYWLLPTGTPLGLGPALRQLGINLATGWFHLYFLLVTMQLYALYPLLAWMIRATRGRHWGLLAGSAAIQLAFTAVLQYWSGPIPAALRTWFDYAQVEVTSYQFYIVAGALAAAHLPACLVWLRRHARAVALGAAAAALGGEGWYAFNLRIGQAPAVASGVFQPVLLALVVGTVAGLWLLAEHLPGAHPPGGRVWRLVHAGSNASFGIYLAHMVPLTILVLPGVEARPGLGRLAWPALAAVRFVLVLGGAAALVWVLRWTPLSQVLTGRPSLWDGQEPEPAGRELPAPPADVAPALTNARPLPGNRHADAGVLPATRLLCSHPARPHRLEPSRSPRHQ